MGHHPGHLKLITPLQACRPKFLLASASPVLVGSALGFAAIKSANKKDLSTPGKCIANRTTVLLHTLGTLALTVGFIVFALLN